MRQTAIAILAGLSLSACATTQPNPAPKLTCFQWTILLKEGLIRPGLDRSTVQRTCQHFDIPRNSSEKKLCGAGPMDQRWDCYVEDYSCDRGELTAGTVLVIYKLKEGPSTGPSEPGDVPGHVWVVDYCGFQEKEVDSPPPSTTGTNRVSR